MKLKITSKDFQVTPGEKVNLKQWPTRVKPLYKSKKNYHKLLESRVTALNALQRLHYASNRYAVLLILQGMDAAHCDVHYRRHQLAAPTRLRLGVGRELPGEGQSSAGGGRVTPHGAEAEIVTPKWASVTGGTG